MTRRAPVGSSTNLVGVPTALVGSCDFQDRPVPLHIAGVREMNASLFEMLAQAPDLAEAGEAFLCYMTAAFGLDPEQREEDRRNRVGTQVGPRALQILLPAPRQGLGP